MRAHHERGAADMVYNELTRWSRGPDMPVALATGSKDQGWCANTVEASAEPDFRVLSCSSKMSTQIAGASGDSSPCQAWLN